MDRNIHLLDVVALATDMPQRSLLRGQVGTVVEVLTDNQYEVEFADDQGCTYAQTALAGEDLIVLRYRPSQAA